MSICRVATTAPAATWDREFNSLINSFYGDAGVSNTRSVAMQPAVDVEEADESYRFVVELPGLNKADVNVSLENNLLAISGERKPVEDNDKNVWRRRERLAGAFSRSFRLPRSVIADKISAEMADGILTVTVPKAEEAKARTIQVS
jgi:HSP20 family protein